MFVEGVDIFYLYMFDKRLQTIEMNSNIYFFYSYMLEKRLQTVFHCSNYMCTNVTYIGCL